MVFALASLDLNPACDLNISFVEDDYMSELHLKWMDEPGTTDVLSFPMDLPEVPGEVVTLGDIVISPVGFFNSFEPTHKTSLGKWLFLPVFSKCAFRKNSHVNSDVYFKF